MTPKLQNILHWILVIALTVLSVEPAINGAVHDHLTGQQLIDGLVGILIAIATKFVYYANTVKGTTVTTSVLSSVNPQNVPQATVLTSTTNIPTNVSSTGVAVSSPTPPVVPSEERPLV